MNETQPVTARLEELMTTTYEYFKSRKGLTFVILLLTLGLGITIGTIISDGVSGAGQKVQVDELKIQGEGVPLALDDTASVYEGFSKVADTVGPAVVNISTQSIIERTARRGGPGQQDPFREFFGDEFWDRFFGPNLPQTRKSTSLGSGVIVDSKGYIISNHHVVAPIQEQGGNRRIADKIEVQLSSGKTHIAEVIGVDPESDISVLRIRSDGSLPFAKVGDSTRLNVGDWVVAIGSPFGLDHTVTAGIVSATQRVGLQTDIFGSYIQTDAAINPGNSGGPLVNMKGEVVGINTFITTTSGSFAGVGFAVPSSVFVNSYNQLVSNGHIERGWLGVSMNTYPMTPEMAEFFGVAGNDPDGVKDGDGVLVTQLIDEKGDPAETGPAAKAGIQPGDVIVEFGDREVESLWDLRAVVANSPPGQTIPVTVVRKGQVIHTDVTLAQRTLEDRQRSESEGISLDEKPEEEQKPKEIGLEVKTLSDREAEQLGLDGENGVVILSVSPGSLADDAGLQPRQVITEVNGGAVTSVQDLKSNLDSISKGEGVVLRVVTPLPNRQKSVAFTSFVKP